MTDLHLQEQMNTQTCRLSSDASACAAPLERLLSSLPQQPRRAWRGTDLCSGWQRAQPLVDVAQQRGELLAGQGRVGVDDAGLAVQLRYKRGGGGAMQWGDMPVRMLCTAAYRGLFWPQRTARCPHPTMHARHPAHPTTCLATRRLRHEAVLLQRCYTKTKA